MKDKSSENEKKSSTFSNLIQGTIWNIKEGYRINKFQYCLLFVLQLMISTFPILRNFMAAKVFGILVLSLKNGVHSVTPELTWTFVYLFSLTLAVKLCETAFEYTVLVYRHQVDLQLWSSFMEKRLYLEMAYHEDSDFKAKENIVSDSLVMRFMVNLRSVQSFIANLISIGTISGIFFTINPLMLAFIILPVLLNFFINKKFGKAVYSIWSYRGDEKKHASYALRGLSELDIIQESKIYGFGQYIVEVFRRANIKFNSEVISKIKAKTFYSTVITVLEVIVLVGLQIYFALETLATRITVTQFTFYISSLGTISQNLARIENNVTELIENSQYLYEAKNFFALENSIDTNDATEKLPYTAPSIEFKNVSFKYPGSDTYVFQNLSFKVNSGEKIALVGENGAGKSTIIKLIARFYDVEEGEILINGKNIKEINLTSFYSLWGVLFQKFAKYWFSIAENIGIGNMEFIDDRARIEETGKKAGVDKIVEKLPNGYATMLKTDFKGGIDLSGGQWQKVGIARGIYADPKLIIMDEPTSALDALAESQVFKQLDELAKDTTMIIVSHRFATVRNAHKILVLENGIISEQGTHEELIGNEGLYHKMFTSQAEGYK